ncbi:MAG: hypothetical protein GY940_37850 [bacterium]|nr:hypothetical protein [bacterium]
MSKLRDKLNYLEKDKVKKQWETLDAQEGMSTKAKLEKLVNLGLKRSKSKSQQKKDKKTPPPDSDSLSNSYNTDADEKNQHFIVREFAYPLASVFGKFALAEWKTILPGQLAVIFGEDDCEGENVDPMKLLFFDTETTGLSGGTGTIPFMLGFGYFQGESFLVRIFILNDLYKEDAFLEEIDGFLGNHDFSAAVTYNGKSFDFPLMESRYILQRKRFPLLKLPHLDFLYPARIIWKNTYESRRLGYLGDVLLGMSREDDVDGSQIPGIYFNYLRSKSFNLIRSVVDHNALDLVGLASLVLLGAKYQEDIGFTDDEGEILGIARLFEKYGNFEEARRLFDLIKQSGTREAVVSQAVKGLAIIKKKQKLYSDASELWELLAQMQDQHLAVRELSVHLEHREKNYVKALYYVQKGLESVNLTETQRNDLEKRLKRLTKKIAALDNE